MANPHRGDLAFKAGDKEYTLCFSIDALCSLEEAAEREFGLKGVIAISNELSSPERMTVRLVRLVLWAGLQRHHPEIDVKAAGEIIGEAEDGLASVVPAISKAFELAFPADGGKKKGHPRKPG